MSDDSPIIDSLIATTDLVTLGPEHLESLAGLAEACASHDGFRPELYTAVSSGRRHPQHFLASAGGELCGYLGLLVFDDHWAEIVGLVHPSARRRGIFSALFRAAGEVALAQGLSRLTITLPHISASARAFASKVGAVPASTEYRMRCTSAPTVPVRPELSLRLGGFEDRELISRLDAAAFESSYAVNFERLGTTLRDEDRRVWVLEDGGVSMGKIHARGDYRGVVVIHDLCIAPDGQRRGRGHFMIASVVAGLLGEGARAVTLEVVGGNEAALGVYERCGFEVVEVHEFWTVPL